MSWTGPGIVGNSCYRPIASVEHAQFDLINVVAEIARRDEMA